MSERIAVGEAAIVADELAAELLFEHGVSAVDDRSVWPSITLGRQ